MCPIKTRNFQQNGFGSVSVVSECVRSFLGIGHGRKPSPLGVFSLSRVRCVRYFSYR